MSSPTFKIIKRVVAICAILVIFAGAMFGISWLMTAQRVSQVFASTSAAQMCAGIFISNLYEQKAYDKLFLKKPPRDRIYNNLDFFIDRDAKRITVDGWLVSPVQAVYSDKRGCVLQPDSEPVNLDNAAVLQDSTQAETDRKVEIVWAKRAALPEYVEAQKLDAAIEQNFTDPAHNTHSFLIYYDGQLVREVYSGAGNPNMPLESWSLGKTLVGALAGHLIMEGKLGLDEKVVISHWPEATDPRRNIRIRDLLQMASGLDFSTEAEFFPYFSQSDHGLIYTNLKDVVAFSANRKLAREPGTLGNYNNADVLLLMEYIRQKLNISHQELITLIQDTILKPLGMNSIRLSTDFAGNPVITGYVYGSARDWGQLALAYYNKGELNGYQLFSEDFYNFIQQPSPNYPDKAYGGMIWLNNHGYYKAPKDALVMSGAGDQVIIIAPEQKLIIVRMGHLNKSKTTSKVFNESFGKIFEIFGNGKS